MLGRADGNAGVAALELVAGGKLGLRAYVLAAATGGTDGAVLELLEAQIATLHGRGRSRLHEAAPGERGGLRLAQRRAVSREQLEHNHCFLTVARGTRRCRPFAPRYSAR